MKLKAFLLISQGILALVPRFIIACDFLIFANICGLHANSVNLHTEERASRRNFDWLFC